MVLQKSIQVNMVAVLRVCTGAQEQETNIKNGVKWMLHGKNDWM
jgi:hypothetical protein